MGKSKPLTRKRIEEAIRRAHEERKTLIEELDKLNIRVKQVTKIAKEMVGLFLVFKKKGLVTDVEINEALNDAAQKSAQSMSVQPKDSRPVEDSVGNGGH